MRQVCAEAALPTSSHIYYSPLPLCPAGVIFSDILQFQFDLGQGIIRKSGCRHHSHSPHQFIPLHPWDMIPHLSSCFAEQSECMCHLEL